MNLLPEKNTLKEDLIRDWKTFRSLHGTDRIQFVYDYYKWPILVLAFILITLITVGKIIWEGQREYRLRVCVTLNAETDLSSLWFDRFSKELTSDEKGGYLDINHDQPFDYSNSYSYLHELEVMTTVSSYRMDVAVCNGDMYSYLLAINACAPLDQVLSEGLYLELQEKGMILHETAGLQIQSDGTVDDSGAVEGEFGILLTDTEFAKTYDQTDEGKPLYGVIIANTENFEDCEALIQAITQ